MDEKYYICQENNHISTEKFHCLVHIFQKDKVNDLSKWRNKTPKNVEKRRKNWQKMKISMTKIRIHKLKWSFGKLWKSRKIHPNWQTKFTSIFFQKRDFYWFKIPNRMTQKYLIMKKFMDFCKGVPLWFLKIGTQCFS